MEEKKREMESNVWELINSYKKQKNFKLSNYVALLFFDIYKDHKFTQKEIAVWLSKLTGYAIKNINVPALLTKLHKLKHKNRNKRGKCKEDFDCTIFTIPTFSSEEQGTLPKHVVEETKPVKVYSKPCKFEELWREQKKVLRSNKKNLSKQKSTHTKYVHSTNIYIQGLQTKISNLKAKVRKCTVDKNKKAMDNRDVKLLREQKNMLKSKDRLIVKLKSKLKLQRNEQAKLQTKSRTLDATFSSLKLATLELDKLREEKFNLEKDILQHQKSNDELADSVTFLENIINDDYSTISLYDDDKGSFKPEAVSCFMQMLQFGVSTQHISSILACAAQLFKCNIDVFPSRQTLDRINIRRLSVAHEQIKDLKTKSGLTLHTDETTKYGTKYMVYATHTEDAPVVLGLTEIQSKSAADTLDTLINMLKDISKSCGQENLGDHIIVNIKNTMSDRAGTEKLFNKLLQQYRETLLPNIVQNYDELSENDCTNLTHINSFFCGLHLLVSLAEDTNKCLKKLEDEESKSLVGAAKESDTKMFIRTNESGVIRCIRTSCNAFARGGDEKSGCYADFSQFLKDKNVKSTLTEFKHQRFNIVFHNAGEVFHLSSLMKSFLDTVHGTTNTLLKAVLYDLKESWCLSGCKVLGLLSKVITAPLWRIIEDKSVHIIDMGTYYTDVVDFLTKCSTDEESAQNFLKGEYIPQTLQHVIDRDGIWKEMVKSSEYDEIAMRILKCVSGSWSMLLKRLLEDHLPGGKYHSVSEEKRAEMKSVVKHNKLAEELFAQLDRLMVKRPNATSLTNEAHIVFNKNKTAQWLNDKNDNERNAIIARSSKNAFLLQTSFQEKKKDIEAYRRQKIIEKEAKLTKLREKAFNEREKLTNEMLYYGLWQSCDEINAKLYEIQSTTEKMKALKVQLNFRRIVLQQPVQDKKVYNFSSKADGQFSLNKLIQNLSSLIESANTMQSETLPCNPLVGKQIQHKFKESKGLHEKWYSGRVISRVPGFPSWYNVVYDSEPENVYTFKLMKDYEEGDLVIMSTIKEDEEESLRSNQSNINKPGTSGTDVRHVKKRRVAFTQPSTSQSYKDVVLEVQTIVKSSSLISSSIFYVVGVLETISIPILHSDCVTLIKK